MATEITMKTDWGAKWRPVDWSTGSSVHKRTIDSFARKTTLHFRIKSTIQSLGCKLQQMVVLSLIIVKAITGPWLFHIGNGRLWNKLEKRLMVYLF